MPGRRSTPRPRPGGPPQTTDAGPRRRASASAFARARRARLPALVLAIGAAAAGVPATSPASAGTPRTAAEGPIAAVGAENQYADVIAQVGGRYVRVSSIMSNPNADPHAFEASPAVARLVASARLVVQNGAGYDSFMNRVESASPSRSRTVVVVARLLGLASKVRNPHLWYEPGTMAKVASAVADDLAGMEPGHRSYFDRNAARFDASLGAWRAAIARLRARFRGAPVGVTEPVADYLLSACGLDDKTPWALQAAIMNGVDPSPQAVATEERLVGRHEVRVLLYNEQVTDPLTQSLLGLAHRSGVPVVGVYETMPTPGYDYQTWMLAETSAIEAALARGRSTGRL